MKSFIFPLAFLALLFAPGFGVNSLINRLFACAILLVIAEPRLKPKLEITQKLFLAWLAWAALSCALSPHSEMALQGYYLRSEGLLTWLVLTCFAFAYWSYYEGAKAMTLLLTVSCLVLFWFMRSPEEMPFIMPEVALGGFAALAAVYIYGNFGGCVPLLPLIPLLYSGQRSAIAAVVAGIACRYVFIPLSARAWKTLLVVACLCAAIIPLTPLKAKLAHSNPFTIGQGARSDWIRQAYDLSFDRPLTGFGLDTLSKYLQPASEAYRHKSAIPDRTHNIAFDLILQTGWVGYLLALLVLGAAFGVTWKGRNERNVTCFCVLVAWIVYGLFNPQGVPAHALALIAIYGIRK